jgi:UDP-N-acetylglucosamine 2-epimerase (non-hydrolysing)
MAFPVHLNPAVQSTVRPVLGDQPNIALIPPLNYLPLVHVLGRASVVLTDSGGLQEEAPSLGKPVLVLREVTERPEGGAAGTVRLVGTDRGRIVEETPRLPDDPLAYAAMATAVNPYGDGYASPRIVDTLLESHCSDANLAAARSLAGAR